MENEKNRLESEVGERKSVYEKLLETNKKIQVDIKIYEEKNNKLQNENKNLHKEKQELYKKIEQLKDQFKKKCITKDKLKIILSDYIDINKEIEKIIKGNFVKKQVVYEIDNYKDIYRRVHNNYKELNDLYNLGINDVNISIDKIEKNIDNLVNILKSIITIYKSNKINFAFEDQIKAIEEIKKQLQGD